MQACQLTACSCAASGARTSAHCDGVTVNFQAFLSHLPCDIIREWSFYLFKVCLGCILPCPSCCCTWLQSWEITWMLANSRNFDLSSRCFTENLASFLLKQLRCLCLHYSPISFGGGGGFFMLWSLRIRYSTESRAHVLQFQLEVRSLIVTLWRRSSELLMTYCSVLIFAFRVVYSSKLAVFTDREQYLLSEDVSKIHCNMFGLKRRPMICRTVYKWRST